MNEQMELFVTVGGGLRDGGPRAGRRWAKARGDNRGRHANSLAANAALDNEREARKAQIRCWLIAHGGPATDREILHGLFPGAGDMNLVRPRISDMVTRQTLVEYDHVEDPETGMRVRRVTINGEISDAT